MELSADVIIIGGGPGGSTAATLLARQRHRVLLLEKHQFPRFHIGESLLPYNQGLFAELGVLPKLEAAGFIVKHGAQFHAGNGKHYSRFIFRNGRFTRQPVAFQVERSMFDHLLLQHARDSGADAREGWTAKRFDRGLDHITLDAIDPGGTSHSLSARFLIDASGRANLTANQQELRVFHPRHRKLAIYGHFRRVRLDPAEAGGDTVIVRLPRQWFWLIPIGPDKVSVGCVLDQQEFPRDGRPLEEIFASLAACSPVILDRLRDAQPLRPLDITTDFSYWNRRLAEPRLLRVGDAAGFMDPIFSAGVLLAMHSGRMAARVVDESLHHRHDGGAALVRYERRLRKCMNNYWRLVEAFYTQPFMELFFQPSDRLRIASAVNAVLAGDLEGRWQLAWRLELFYFLMRLQRIFAVVPRVDMNSPR